VKLHEPFDMVLPFQLGEECSGRRFDDGTRLLEVSEGRTAKLEEKCDVPSHCIEPGLSNDGATTTSTPDFQE